MIQSYDPAYPVPAYTPQQTMFQERQTTVISQPRQPAYHDASHVLPVNVVGPQMNNSVMRASNPLYMVDDQYIQRPPNLSYIDKETSTCPVWIWGVLGTLALLGIILTLVLVGKRDSGGYKITKA